MSPLRPIGALLRRTDRWLDDPAVELGVYVVLILLAPLIRLGFEQILRWMDLA